MGSGELEWRFQASPTQRSNAWAAAREHGPSRRLTQRVAAAVGLVAGAVVVTNLRNGVSLLDALLDALPWIVLAAFWSKFSALVPKSMYEKWAGPAFGDEIRSFSPNGIFTSSPAGAHNYTWESVREVAESEEFFLFYPSRGEVIYVPK